MIFGIGVDTMEVARIAETITQYSNQFVRRIFTNSEISYCLSHRFSAEHFAARFAAKEAFSKALGTGIRQGFVWREVEVGKEFSGKPRIVIHGSMIEKVTNIVGRDYRVQLSMTHTKNVAEAVVVIEKL